MSKNLNMVEDVEIALKGMAKFPRRVSRSLKSTEKEAVLEAFGELGQYAATIQDEEDLIAFSGTLYHIINEAPTLCGFLPKKRADGDAGAFNTKEVSLSLDNDVSQETLKSQHVNQRAVGMANELHVITGNKTTQPSTTSSPQDLADRLRWLSDIKKCFRTKIEKKSLS